MAELDIAAFLRARLDEREAGNSDPLHVDSVHAYTCDLFEELGEKCDCGEPAFVLADVAAKRQIIERCTTNVEYEGEPVADDVLRLLALPYAGHPDYDESWKP